MDEVWEARMDEVKERMGMNKKNGRPKRPPAETQFYDKIKQKKVVRLFAGRTRSVAVGVGIARSGFDQTD